MVSKITIRFEVNFRRNFLYADCSHITSLAYILTGLEMDHNALFVQFDILFMVSILTILLIQTVTLK